MSFNLKNASIGLRKASWLQGVKSGTYEPVFDHRGGPEAVVAKVTDNSGRVTEIRSGDVEYAQAQTWAQIKN